MTQPELSGGCTCGAVRFECDAAPALVAHCHCRDCQRSSGGAMSTVFAVPRSAFRQTQGKTTTYGYTGDSGQPVTRHFCPTCGAPLYTDVAVMSEMWFVRAASLDKPAAVTPTMHIYCDSAQPWDQPGDGLPRFGKMPG